MYIYLIYIIIYIYLIANILNIYIYNYMEEKSDKGSDIRGLQK